MFPYPERTGRSERLAEQFLFTTALFTTEAEDHKPPGLREQGTDDSNEQVAGTRLRLALEMCTSSPASIQPSPLGF